MIDPISTSVETGIPSDTFKGWPTPPPLRIPISFVPTARTPTLTFGSVIRRTRELRRPGSSMRPINPPTDTTAMPSLIPLCVPFPISIMYGSKFETERAVISATIVSWPPRFSRSNWVRSAANSSTAPSVVTRYSSNSLNCSRRSAFSFSRVSPSERDSQASATGSKTVLAMFLNG